MNPQMPQIDADDEATMAAPPRLECRRVASNLRQSARHLRINPTIEVREWERHGDYSRKSSPRRNVRRSSGWVGVSVP